MSSFTEEYNTKDFSNRTTTREITSNRAFTKYPDRRIAGRVQRPGKSTLTEHMHKNPARRITGTEELSGKSLQTEHSQNNPVRKIT